MKLRFALLATLLSSAALYAADAPTVARLYDNQLRTSESEVVPLAEAMPPEKYAFAPTAGEFKGVRSFLQQVKHIATTNYTVCAAVLNEKSSIDPGKDENGPASIDSKEQAVKFLKDSYAYCHKAVATLTPANQLDLMKSPFGDGQAIRGGLASVPVWHSFDHYGQMVEYARMNGVIPPASK